MTLARRERDKEGPFRFLLSPSRVLTKINGVPALECSQRVANEFYTRDIRVSPSYPPIPLSRGSILSVPRTGKKWNDNEIIEVYIHNRVCFDGHPDDGLGVDAWAKKKICIHYSQGGRRFFFFSPSFHCCFLRLWERARYETPTWMSERGVTVLLPVKGSQRSFILVVKQELPLSPVSRHRRLRSHNEQLICKQRLLDSKLDG